MNDVVARLIKTLEGPMREAKRAHNQGLREAAESKDFLDDVLDGKPCYRVDTPGFRRALRVRAEERADEALSRRIAKRLGINPERER